MANHPYNNHREQQVAHRRVGTILSGSPAGAEKHAKGHAFSKLTSKSAAVRDDDISGRKSPQRFARGGKVKHGGGNTNIAIVLPKGGGPAPGGPAATPSPMAGPGGPPPMGAPPPGMPPGPPGMPPGMPMRARGGRINKADGGTVGAGGPKFKPITPTVAGNFERATRNSGSDEESARISDIAKRRYGVDLKNKGGAVGGEATEGNIKKWGGRAKANSYFTGGAITGVGREEKAAHMKGRK
jgi:hypothetical protein